jgi:hypothetical protein
MCREVALVFCAVVIVGLPSGTAGKRNEQVTAKQQTVTTENIVHNYKGLTSLKEDSKFHIA